MMKRLITGLFLACVVVASAATAQVPVTGANATLQDIVGTSTLITVVLRDRGSMDRNCQLVDIGPNYISVINEQGQRFPYLFRDIAEIRVQGGRVEQDRYDPDASRTLTEEEAAAANRALSRAREIFDRATENQSVRMDAAALLVLHENPEARTYLEGLASSNDLETSLEALIRLYVAGESLAGRERIQTALESGNRTVKRLGITLAGLTGDTAFIPQIRPSAEDRMAEISAPAVRALARLGDRQVIPTLYEMIGSLNTERGEAAVDALVMLGGDDIVQRLESRFENAVRIERQRILEVLYRLGAEDGERRMIEQMQTVPTLARRTGIVLASEGNFYARSFLSDRLNQRFDRDQRTLMCRAEMAAAVLRGGDRKSIAVLQDLLRMDDPTVREQVLRYIAEMGRRVTLPVIEPSMQSNDLRIAVRACEAVFGATNNEFRQRLVDSWFRETMRGHCEL